MGVSSVSNAKSVTRSFLATGTGASGWHSTEPVTAKLASSTPDTPSSTLSPATAARTASPFRSRPLTVATSSAGPGSEMRLSPEPTAPASILPDTARPFSGCDL